MPHSVGMELSQNRRTALHGSFTAWVLLLVERSPNTPDSFRLLVIFLRPNQKRHWKVFFSVLSLKNFYSSFSANHKCHLLTHSVHTFFQNSDRESTPDPRQTIVWS